MKKDIQLEYKINENHLPFMIDTGLITHNADPFWSYAKHLPEDWDSSKIDRRTRVAQRLMDNLLNIKSGEEMDLSPLKDDQRVAGKVYGENPLKNAYDIIEEYARIFPEHEFFAKWGGGKHWMKGKALVFYIENEEEAKRTIEGLNEAANYLGVPIEMKHKLGVSAYREWIKIDERLRSEVGNPGMLEFTLKDLIGYTHFNHELFKKKR